MTLAMSGAGYPFVWIGSHHLNDSERLAGQIGINQYGVSFKGFTGEAGFLLLAVPDDAIGEAASEALRAGVIAETTVAAHMSGALGSDILADLRKAGASVMAFHPAQSFTQFSDPDTVFKNICFDMEGDDAACSLGARIAHDLGAESVRLDPEARLVTHLAMTVASNYTVSVIRMAEEIIMSAGIAPETAENMLIPLFSTTAKNITALGTTKALTGPVSRGDVEIIRKHCSVLESMDETYRTLYNGLAIIALRIAVERGSVTESQAATVKKLISG
jgi:predicted short-subunit dehydrogenase-like oxidoreductase (DUF2520 family)